jgi:hypothetical protein
MIPVVPLGWTWDEVDGTFILSIHTYIYCIGLSLVISIKRSCPVAPSLIHILHVLHVYPSPPVGMGLLPLGDPPP